LTNSGTAAVGRGKSVVVWVECQGCGERYETDLPIAAVLRVRRCRVCGRQALEPLEPEVDSEAGMESDRSPESRR
jgi:ribosomal protein L37E